MVQLRIIAATLQGSSVEVSDETSVGETRDEVAKLLGVDRSTLKLNFKGKDLGIDDAEWESIGPAEGDKLYVAVDTSALSRQAMNTHGSVHSSSAAARASAPGAARGGDGMNLPPAMQEAFLNSITPETIDSYFRMIPELRAMERERPEVARELRDPDTFRAMIRSQLDPTSRRMTEQAQSSQMAQIGFTPGAWQEAERIMHSLDRDSAREGASGGDASAAASEPAYSSAEPRPGQASNNEPLPNPWARPAANPAAAAGGGVPGNPAAAGLFANRPPMPRQPGEASGSPANPFAAMMANPQMMQSMMSMFGMGPPPRQQPQPPQPTAEPASSLSGAASTTGYAYTRQLRMLTEDMGFEEEVARLALEETKGDVDEAVNLIAQWTDE